jgi:small subunit ribosomal protein S25e
MGGKKKRSIKQMTKAQKKDSGKKEKSVATSPSEKKSIPGITPPNLKSDKFVNELKKMNVLTPYSVASRFNVRLSVAKNFLKELENKGMIEFISKSRNLKIYKPVD